MSIEGDKLFVSQFNKYLDIVIIWVALYLYFNHNAIFLFIPSIAAGVAVWIYILAWYDQSLRGCEHHFNFMCENCSQKSYQRFLKHKYAPKPTTEEIYWQSEQREGETIEQTKVRVWKTREDHKNKKAKELAEYKAKYPNAFKKPL